MNTTYHLSENVSVEVDYSIVKDEAFPRGPEEVGRERVYDAIQVNSVRFLTVKLECIQNSLTIHIGGGEREAIRTYVETQMNQNVEHYTDDGS
jgi:hypothetical protein